MKKKKKKKKRRSGKIGNDNRRLWVSLGMIFALLVCAVSILLYLEVHREKVQEWLHPESEKTLKGPVSSELERLNRRIDIHLQGLFRKHGIGPENVRASSHREGLGVDSFVFKRIEAHVVDKGTASDMIKELTPFVNAIPDCSLLVRKEVSGQEERTTLSIRIGSRITREVALRPLRGIPVPTPHTEKHVRVAIIIDDIGESLQTVEAFLSMDVPFTFSILPGLKHSVDAARLIHGRQREVMLHLPMEPLNHAEAKPGESLLTVQMDPDEIRSRVNELLTGIPYLAGVNNHMGSRFTEDRKRMAVVLEEIKKKGLFFVDSLTIADSVAFEESQRLGLNTGKRDIFLDHVDRERSVAIQIEKLICVAQGKGSAIAICHPKKTTIKALRQAMERFRSQGVEIVPVSELIG